MFSLGCFLPAFAGLLGRAPDGDGVDGLAAVMHAVDLGALLDGETLRAIVEVARKTDAWLHCDEVYRH